MSKVPRIPSHLKRSINIVLTETEMENFITETKANSKATLIAPHILYLGAVKNSNYGSVEGLNPADQTTFQQVFAGQDDILAVWEGSTTAKIVEGQNYMIKKFQVGRTIKGLTSSQQAISTFGKKASTDLGDFTTQQASVSQSVIFETPQLTFNDLFKFFIIPHSGSNQYTYLSQLITYVSPSGNMLQEAIFSSVNDLLEASGSAISQYIQPAPIGSGYAFPKLNHDDKGDPEFILDKERQFNYPATNIQIEIYGPGIFLGMPIMGRPSSKKDGKIYAPRLLGFHKFLTPIESTLTNFQSGENNYKFIYGARAEALKYWSNWKDKIKSLYDEGAKANFEGTLSTNIENTNKTNLGIPNYDSWNTGWTHQLTESEMGTTFTPENRLTIGKMNMNPGAKMSDHITAAGVGLMGMLKLPISIVETVVWGLKDIPVVGPFFNAFVLGVPLGWQNTNEVLAGKPIAGLIPSTLYDFASNLGLDETDGVIPLDFFRDDSSDNISAVLGTSTTTLTLRFSLTDMAQRKFDVEGGMPELRKNNTRELGQSKENNGWQLNGKEEWLDPELGVDEGYEIDITDPIILGKASYKITVFNGSTKIYESVHQTRAKFTDSIREIHNPNKHSNWEDIEGKTIDYPEALPDPLPPSVEFPDLAANLGFKYSYESNITNESDSLRKTEHTINIESLFGMDLDELIGQGYIYMKFTTSHRHEWGEYGDTGLLDSMEKINIRDIMSSSETNPIIVLAQDNTQSSGTYTYTQMGMNTSTGYCEAGWSKKVDTYIEQATRIRAYKNEDNNIVFMLEAKAKFDETRGKPGPADCNYNTAAHPKAHSIVEIKTMVISFLPT